MQGTVSLSSSNPHIFITQCLFWVLPTSNPRGSLIVFMKDTISGRYFIYLIYELTIFFLWEAIIRNPLCQFAQKNIGVPETEELHVHGPQSSVATSVSVSCESTCSHFVLVPLFQPHLTQTSKKQLLPPQSSCLRLWNNVVALVCVREATQLCTPALLWRLGARESSNSKDHRTGFSKSWFMHIN